MRGRRIVFFFCVVFLSACASSEPRNSALRIVHNRQEVAGCAMVDFLPVGEGIPVLPGNISPQTRARVTSLGGNVLFLDIEANADRYVEVWSCPAENLEAPR